MKAHMEARKQNDPAAADQRKKLRDVILYKSYEFNCHGVEMNQRYVSKAIIPDTRPEPVWQRDKELFYQATTYSGAHLPHIWLGRNGHKISTLDLAGKGAFTLFTGIGGDAWVTASQKLAVQLDIAINTVMIGPGCVYADLYGDWAGTSDIEENGCLLVRPDFHIALRENQTSDIAEKVLSKALLQILGW